MSLLNLISMESFTRYRFQRQAFTVQLSTSKVDNLLLKLLCNLKYKTGLYLKALIKIFDNKNKNTIYLQLYI